MMARVTKLLSHPRFRSRSVSAISKRELCGRFPGGPRLAYGRLLFRQCCWSAVVKRILYVDMDNVLVDFPSAFSRISEETKKAFDGRLDDVPGIFSLMDPVPGAIDAFVELAGRFDAFILSTSPWANPSAWSDKLMWVKKHLGSAAYKRLILTLS